MSSPTTQELLDVIADKVNKQKDVAKQYQKGFDTTPDIDWHKVNRAIVKRWTKSGLGRVKALAWRMELEKIDGA